MPGINRESELSYSVQNCVAIARKLTLDLSAHIFYMQAHLLWDCPCPV